MLADSMREAMGELYHSPAGHLRGTCATWPTARGNDGEGERDQGVCLQVIAELSPYVKLLLRIIFLLFRPLYLRKKDSRVVAR